MQIFPGLVTHTHTRRRASVGTAARLLWNRRHHTLVWRSCHFTNSSPSSSSSSHLSAIQPVVVVRVSSKRTSSVNNIIWLTFSFCIIVQEPKCPQFSVSIVCDYLIKCKFARDAAFKDSMNLSMCCGSQDIRLTEKDGKETSWLHQLNFSNKMYKAISPKDDRQYILQH